MIWILLGKIVLMYKNKHVSMNKKALIAIILVIVLVPTGVYALSPLFFNTMIDEPAPTMKDSKMPIQEKEGTSKPLVTMNQDSIGKMLSSGGFVGRGDQIHDVTGVAKILKDESGLKYLRLENFKSTNGPDLHVYLATDEKASDYVILGKLKANIGNQNYEIPDGVDLAKYHEVLIWCKQFSVLFGSAELA